MFKVIFIDRGNNISTFTCNSFQSIYINLATITEEDPSNMRICTDTSVLCNHMVIGYISITITMEEII